MGWLLPRKRHICTTTLPISPLDGRYIFVTVQEAGSPGSRPPQMRGLVKFLFPASPAVSSCGAVRASPWVSTLVTSAKPNDLLKAPPPNTVALEIRVRHTNFWGSVNIQFLTVYPPGPPNPQIMSLLPAKYIHSAFSSPKVLTPACTLVSKAQRLI